MKPVTVCNCNPNGHVGTSTDAALIRRIRRDCLENAKRWQADPKKAGAVVCVLYKAHLCLLRLRELKTRALKAEN